MTNRTIKSLTRDREGCACARERERYLLETHWEKTRVREMHWQYPVIKWGVLLPVTVGNDHDCP